MKLPPLAYLDGTAPKFGWRALTQGLADKYRLLDAAGIAMPWAPQLYAVAAEADESDLNRPEAIELVRHVTPGRSNVSAVGLAYPQLTAAAECNLAIIAVQTGMHDLRDESRTDKVVVLRNPRYEPVEEAGKTFRLEVCLSSPGIAVALERWNEIWLYVPGQARQRVGGIYAWILQHEIDHLNGVLCTDLALRQEAVYARNLYWVPPEWHAHFFKIDGGFKPGTLWPLFPVDQYKALRAGTYDPTKYL